MFKHCWFPCCIAKMYFSTKTNVLLTARMHCFIGNILASKMLPNSVWFANVCQVLETFRSRFYRSRVLRVNFHFAACFKLYTLCALVHRSKQKQLAKFVLKSAILVKFQRKCIFQSQKKLGGDGERGLHLQTLRTALFSLRSPLATGGLGFRF